MTDYELKPRSSFWLTRFLDNFGGGVFWTTFGNTIYYPNVYDLDTAKLFTEVIEHEKVHVEQYKKYGVFLFLFLYVLVPLPVVFAYFRWKFERKAYLVELKYIREHRKDLSVDEVMESVVGSLWNNYLFTWPKPLMRRWFKNQLLK